MLADAKMLTNATAARVVRTAAIGAIAATFIFLAVMSVLVQHVEFINSRPVKFACETLLLGLCGAAPVYYIAYSRKSSYKRATRDFLLLMIKFAILWVLFELSGVNSILFPMKRSALIKRGLLAA